MIFKGSATALVTPFTDDKVDAHALENMVARQLDNGTNALVVLGTTGEPATLNDDEKAQVLDIVLNKAKGKIPVIVGAASNSTAKAIDACKNAQKQGADGLLVVTPYYNKCTQEGLVEHYGAIAASTSLPIIVYNVPSRTGVNILPPTFKRIVDENDNIVGIKEASGNMAQIMECIRLVGSKACVYSGDDALALPVIAMSGSGVISVASNVYPKEMSEMCGLALCGDIESARKYQLALLPLINALFCEVNPIPVKMALALKGLCSAKMRLPLTEMSTENTKKLEKTLYEFEQLYPTD